MSREPATSGDLISTLLSPEHQNLVDFSDNIDVLAENAKRIISANITVLRKATERCQLDILLISMLDHAPHPQGRRYVAAVLCAASERGSGMVVEVAIAWMDSFFWGQLLINI